jgi:hemerythrin
MLMTTDAHPTQTETTYRACHTDRLQPYRFIHKALRALMFRTLQQAASLDACDTQERQALTAAVEELLQTCSDHLSHENTFFHVPLRERAPRAVMAFDDDHEEHVRGIERLRRQLGLVAQGGPAARQHAYLLYLELTRFVSENLAHMADEETLLTTALWQHFSDEEIDGMGRRLKATFTPQEGAYYLRWMVRGLNHAELVELMGEARAAMPPAVFAGTCDMLRYELPAARWTRLARALGLPPVQGLVTA